MSWRTINNDKKNKMLIDKIRKTGIISMFIFLSIALILIWIIPLYDTLGKILISCSILLSLFLLLYWFISWFKWTYKENGIVINDSVYVWNRLKKKYLGWSLVTGITQIIVLILTITIFVLWDYENTIYNTVGEIFVSPPVIVLYICVPIILFNIFAIFMNRIIMIKIFCQDNFSEKFALENNWFFKNSWNIYIYIGLHTITIIGNALAFMTYKEIEQNIKDNLTREPIEVWDYFKNEEGK